MTDRGARPGTGTPPEELAQRLEALGYLELFLREDSTTLDEIWGLPASRDGLRQLALTPGVDALPAFLAAEVLFARDPGFPARSERGLVARTYAGALRQNATEIANPWGLPGELDGEVAAHVLSLGDVAVPELAGLLDDPTPLSYSGSKEATAGNSYAYRVKDVSASIIAALLRVPFAVHQDPRRRDVEIARLRSRLG